ncbi:hypothetical protein F3Y22_tig00110770pilonHSYRG00025 [Hibiscus syriacus]|uniref:Uncharacterized protein n=1 Tax=Hibiscus syriacus TaxID=106335 RepID=A0A6A2ZST4_HIBSY|nr:hypothetical protein F3Y22_tig00110770pilonHSYRG00025 [Hibiscus syriacus]
MPLLPKQYDDICESPHIPFPFHLNASCPLIFTVIRLLCLNFTTLYLHIGTETYRVLDFLSDGVLVDFPGTTGCRQCRGFSSWLVAQGSNTSKRGVKLEWVIPRNSSDRVRANDAYMVNAIAV